MDNLSLVSLITHELRTPLTAIRGYTSLLAQSKSINEDSKNILEKIHVDTVKEIYVLNDASQLLRFELKTETPAFELVNLHEFIQERIEHLRQEEGDEKKLKFEIKSPHDVSASIQKDYMGMLIDFLLKHSARGSRKKSGILIEINEEEGSVSINLHENGPSVHSDNAPLPADPFYFKGEPREDNEDDLRSGLELYICNEVAKKIPNIKLLVSSKGSIGNTFKINFPINSQ